jgi:hypothetical protein
MTPTTFTLQVSPAAYTAAPLACAGTASISLDSSNTTKGLGGPTTGAGICYTTDGVTAPGCTAGGAVTCVANGALPAVTGALSTNTTIKAQTCLANFSGTTNSQVYTFTPYTHTIAPIDGTVANFTAGSEQVPGANCGVATCTASGTQNGYITYDATNVYVGMDNVPAAPGAGAPWYATAYFGTGGAGGATKDLPLFANNMQVSRNISAGANIQWALQWNTTTPTTAPLWFTWNSGTGAWAQAATYPGTFGAAAAGTVEFSIPLSAFGTPATLYSFGSVLSNVGGAANATEQFRFPGTASAPNVNTQYDEFFADTRSSCLGPNAQVAPFTRF